MTIPATSSRYPKAPPPKAERMQIRGKNASSYEVNFAMALEDAGLEYLFQVEYWGGRSLPGGMVLDFLVFSEPMRTPVYINEDYWHSGQRAEIDKLQQATLELFGAGRTAPVLALFRQDVENYAVARKTVREEFGM